MRNLFTITISFLISFAISAQSTSIKGVLMDDTDSPVPYANLVIYDSNDALVKIATTDDSGIFEFPTVPDGTYKLVATYVGYSDYTDPAVIVSNGQMTDLGKVTMSVSSVQLETAVVKARRAMVEIKPDRTVFNVQGTINSTGDNGLGLLRKAPGVLVDNNNNINVLGRSGVLVYVDGKRLPLSGDDLTSYLENLQADQIDRMDIITNPGAKYEAEGNAGIIDIRLKRDKSLGSNGSVNTTLTQGQKFRYNLGASGNYRNKALNTFGTVSYNGGGAFHNMNFINNQNDLVLVEKNRNSREFQNINTRWGTDFFVGKNHTIGFLVSAAKPTGDIIGNNTSEISKRESTDIVDSVLIASNTNSFDNSQSTYNLNYVYNGGNETTVNVDFDYGAYVNTLNPYQPNRYYDASLTNLLTENITRYETTSDINIYTGKLDYETKAGGGKLGLGAKFSKVDTDNEFLFYNDPNEDNTGGELNTRRSNRFDYREQVSAVYANYAGSISPKVNYSAGLRVEHTDATGDLTPFDPDLNEDPVEFDYISYFPSVGITYSPSMMHSWAVNYGRRINRPDYNVLNPFEEQLSELSFRKGNPFLNPEIVNNVEIGYTYAFRYNFKLAYSHTEDQITRLIGPEVGPDADPRAGYINWENLATQDIISFNASLPFTMTSYWDLFVNASTSYLNNQADYGQDGGTVDIQAFTYNLFQQSTLKLGKGYIGEVSGWFSGPGVWGGVFEYDTSYSLNFGLSKKFFNDNLNVKLSGQDVTFQTGWSGVSNFNGLTGEGNGNWDSRFVSLSLNYQLGNNNVKSRKRKTGIEEESKRVGNN